MYDSYEVEYLPNEGVLSTGRYLFVEFTTDGTMTSTGAAIRYEGKLMRQNAEFANNILHHPCHLCSMSYTLSAAFAKGMCYEPFVKYGNFSSSDSTYSVGAVVEFSCDPGYTLEQGSVVIECVDAQNPQWNETEPACRGELTDVMIAGHKKNKIKVLPLEKNLEQYQIDPRTRSFHCLLDHCRS